MINSNENVTTVTQNETQNDTSSRTVTGTIVSIADGKANIKIGETDEEAAILDVDKIPGKAVVGNLVTLKLESKNGNTVITEISSNVTPNDTTDDKDVVEGIVIFADKEDIIVNIGFNTDVTIPASRFTDIEIGDKVKMRVISYEGKIIVTDVLSRTKAPSTDPSPRHKVDEKGNVKAKIRAYNYTTDILEVEVLDDTHDTFSFKLKGFLPGVEFGKDVTVLTTLNLELVKDEDGIERVKCVQIDSTPDAPGSADSEHPEDDEPFKDTNDEEDTKSGDKETDEEDEVNLRYIDKDLMLEVMSVPTHSKLECRMVTYLMQWAKRNDIKIEFDDYGNVYLTKGELGEDEYYPCVTSHMDTVQYKHDPYIYAGVPLSLIVEKTKDNEHKLSVNNEGGTLGTEIGIGADCKAGIVISLSLFDHMEKLKACFFLDEETGCNGSDHLDLDWFKDVGYVIGFDSPDLYRAAWSCNNTKLFNYDFYKKWLKPICDEWGWKDCFYSEPYTDVKNIREKTNIMCMNFGNGGYNAHNIGGTEYMIMEDTDYTCGMAIDLIDYIGLTRHMLKDKKCSSIDFNWESTNGVNVRWYSNSSESEDDSKLETLGDNARNRWHTSYSSSSSSNSSSSNSSSSSSSNSSSSSSSNTNSVKEEDEIKFETVKYITTRYENHISGIKEDVINGIKAVCAAKNVDFEDFEKIIMTSFSNEVKF